VIQEQWPPSSAQKSAYAGGDFLPGVHPGGPRARLVADPGRWFERTENRALSAARAITKAALTLEKQR